MSNVISRRKLLGQGLWGLSLAATAPHFLGLSSRVFAGDDPTNDRILVVLQLSGGNDGLSTVVPYADDAYYRARRNSAIAQKDVLKLGDYSGFHPALQRLHKVYGAGKLALVQGASYPNPNRSHFKSMDVWHTGSDRGRGMDTGWLGRSIDACCKDVVDPNLTINIGKSIPYALEARVHKPISFDAPERYRWTGNPKDKMDFEELNGPATVQDQVDWLHRVAVDARASSDAIRKAAADYQPKADYAGGGQGRRAQLAGDMRTVAALIKAGLSTRVYYISFGGFDTHNNQRGRHDNLMRQLDVAVGAFYEDLRAQGLSDRVLVLGFSEFGRRVKENGSLGTDHGVAGPMFLVGDHVKGGLRAKHPSLTDLDKGDLKMSVDFRSVYATVLDKWIGADSARILGKRYPHLPLL